MSKNTVIGYGLVIGAILVLVGVAYVNSIQSHVPIVFSDKDMLNSLWHNYTTEYVEQNTGRTLDKQQNNITTSEGESYTMLRAVWEDDKTTFDQSWKWTQNNLKRPDDHLFAWLFGAQDNGSYGVLTARGGNNTASDADTDIALSLVFASHRWGDQNYMTAAKSIISDIWTNEVVMIKGKPYLVADNLEKNNSANVLVNVSYLSPYAYRVFAAVDPSHPWNALVDNSYAVIDSSITNKLDTSSSANLPPDWILVNRSTGAVSAPSASSNLTTNYGYDAFRLPWRLAVDYVWNNDPRDKTELDKLSFLGKEWDSNKKLDSTYSHSGAVISQTEVPAMYGGSIGYFIVSDTSVSKDIYQSKLQYLYNPDTGAWKNDLGYYDANWAWFGIALYTNTLISNLALPTTK